MTTSKTLKIEKSLIDKLDSSKKLEDLNKIYIFLFDSIKKATPKKDKNYQEIKEVCNLLKDHKNLYSSYSLLRRCSLLLAKPLEQISSKLMEKIISTFEEIIMKNLINNVLLQEMIDTLFNDIHKYINLNDDGLNIKILNLCYLIYSCDNISNNFNNNIKKFIRIALNIFLSTKNIEVQASSHATLSNIIDIIIKKIKFLYSNNHKLLSKYHNINYSNNSGEDNTTLFCKKYLNFMVDIIELNEIRKEKNKENEGDLVSLYLKGIKDNSLYSSEIEKSEFYIKYLEKITINNTNKSNKNSENINKENDENHLNNIIVNDGYCPICRNEGVQINSKYFFPLCQNKDCEHQLNDLLELSNLEYKIRSNTYRKDYIILLNNLTQFSTIKSEEGTVRFKNKEFCLEIIQELINKGGNYFKYDKEVINIIKDKVFDSLIQNTLSDEINNNIFKLSLNSFIIIIKIYREYLMNKIDIFISKVLIAILESENLGYFYKDSVLDTLINLAENCNILIEIYVNFDCDIKYNEIFSHLINLLTKIIFGLYKKQKYLNTFKPLQEEKLILKCLDFLVIFIDNLGKIVENNEDKYIKKHKLSMNNNFSTNNNETDFSDSQSINADDNNPDEIKDKINQNLKAKALLAKSIDKFNALGPKKCFNFLMKNQMIATNEEYEDFKNKYINNKINKNYMNDDNNININIDNYDSLNIMDIPFISNINPLIYLFQKYQSLFPIKDAINENKNFNKNIISNINYEDYTSFEEARYIKTNIKELNKEVAGEYLCSGKKYNIKVVQYFINSFNFKNLHIVDALRLLFSELYLVGEGQIVDRIVQIFGEKYHKENPKMFKIPDSIYYIAYSTIMLNTNLHREEVKEKMTLNKFITQLKTACPQDEVTNELITDIYYMILNNPIVIPGQKISVNTKTKKELIIREKENILKSAFKGIKYSNINNNEIYIKEINNDNISHLLESIWSNLLVIFSQLLNDENEDLKLYSIYVNIILKISKISGILHLDTITEAFLNTIIKLTNLNNIREILDKNIECIIQLIDFIVKNGQYIRNNWYSLLSLISKIEFYQTATEEDLYREYILRPKSKNPEKDLEIQNKNRELVTKKISDLFYSNIFYKTINYEEEIIINFIDNLCKVSKYELINYHSPRVFSLHKLIEVADFNLKRIQIEWVKIWKLISDHLIFVISSTKQENIWREALESLRQIISKLLQKEDLSIYNFQIDFFKPFQIIFEQTLNKPERGEMVLIYIFNIVGNYSHNIYNGYFVIFNILKMGFARNDNKIKEHIKNILIKIFENFSLFNNEINYDLYKEYFSILAMMYTDENYKQFSLENIYNIFDKGINYYYNNKDSDKDITNNIKFGNLLCYFLYGYSQIFIDKTNEYLELLFKTINKYSKYIIDNEYVLIYLYYHYYKVHLSSITMMDYFYGFETYCKNTKDNNKYYFSYIKDNNIKNRYTNIINYLDNDKNILINDLKDSQNEYLLYDKISNNELNDKIDNIFNSSYINSYTELLNYELLLLNNNEIKDKVMYINSINIYIIKFIDLLLSNKENKKGFKYSFIYEDILLTLFNFIIINNNADKLKDIFIKIFLNNPYKLSSYFFNKIIDKILSYLNFIIENDFKEQKEQTIIDNCNLITSSIMKISQLLIEKNYELFQKNLDISMIELFEKLEILSIKYLKLFNTNDINTKSEILFIIESIFNIKNCILINIKIEDNDFEVVKEKNCIDIIDIFKDLFYKLKMDNNIIKNVSKVIIFYIDNIINKFLIWFSKKALETVFYISLNFVDSEDSELRSSCKNLIKKYIELNLCKFSSFKETPGKI